MVSSLVVVGSGEMALPGFCFFFLDLVILEEEDVVVPFRRRMPGVEDIVTEVGGGGRRGRRWTRKYTRRFGLSPRNFWRCYFMRTCNYIDMILLYSTQRRLCYKI